MKYTPCFVSVALFVSTSVVSAQDAPAPASELTFEKHVRPILKTHCLECHGGGEEFEGQLDLRLRRLMLKGGESGAALVPGDPEESLFLQQIREGEMPPNDTKLKPVELATLEKWVAAGAKTARPEPKTLGKGLGITAEEREFWSFQPIRRPKVPEFAASDRVRTPIDALLLAEMKKRDVSFSADADKETLLRRAYFDLIGLPPSPEQVKAFLADDGADAYERLIEALLASPHYGERWGRHWLDAAGYADSEGYSNADAIRSYAYKYRDYVIRSFNADKPFDAFIQEQLAGDEMVAPPHKNLEPEQIEKLVATGFLRMAADGTGSGANTPEARNQVVFDTVKIVSTSLMGLSVACAQCHDHRYDPIPHEDYFRLRAVFEPALSPAQWRVPSQRRVSLFTDADRQKSAEIEAEAGKVAAEKSKKQAEYMAAALDKELKNYKEPLRGKLRAAYQTPGNKRTDEQKQFLKANPAVNIHPGVLYQYNQPAADDLKKYDARIAGIRAKKPVEDFVRVLAEVPGQVPPTHLFHRGDYRQPKGELSPAGLTIAAPAGADQTIPANDPKITTTGRRLEFARRLTNGKHPLVARVLVNRFWMHHFGRALVGTPGDFGRLGEQPSHPELLDWLASEFMERGWSLKQLHRTIMTSTAYRQSSVRESERDARDPANITYWKKPIQRLDAEVVRDRILAVSGRLSAKMFGPPAAIKADDTGQVIVSDSEGRRSIYVQVRRSQPVAILTAFDSPVMQTNCERRPTTTAATQSLMLMNSDFILAEAGRFAQRVRDEAAEKHDPSVVKGLAIADEHRDNVWQIGYGSVDEKSGRTGAFALLPHWTGSAWQGGSKLPDAKLGWVTLHGSGGHTGNDQQHAAIRRWIAPRDGVLTIAGKLSHGSDQGDGVRGRIVCGESGLAGEWIAKNGEAATAVAQRTVRKGSTVDFVTDCRGDSGFDSFSWTIDLTLKDAGGKPLGSWNAAAGFHGPPPPPLAQQVAYAWQLAYARKATLAEMQLSLGFLKQQIAHLKQQPDAKKPEPEQQAMTNFCQSLLSSNEFLYVD